MIIPGLKPFKCGHYFVAFMILVAIAGFWPTYFVPIGHVSLAFHVHAISAMCWLLLIAQSVAIHRRKNALHRKLGRVSFVIFPLVTLGFTMILDGMVTRYTRHPDAADLVAGPAFFLMTSIAFIAFLVLFYYALKFRRNVRLHAGYLLATPLMLFESAFGRLQDRAFPWLDFIGRQDPQGSMDSIPINDGMAVVLALALYFMDRKHGRPWLMISGFLVARSLMSFATFYELPRTLMSLYAQIPSAFTLSAGLSAGVAVAYLGWQNGGPPMWQKVEVAPTQSVSRPTEDLRLGSAGRAGCKGAGSAPDRGAAGGHGKTRAGIGIDVWRRSAVELGAVGPAAKDGRAESSA